MISSFKVAYIITVLSLPEEKSLIFNLLFGGDLGWGEIYTYKIQFVTKK
jgi:hypothetical protein